MSRKVAATPNTEQHKFTEEDQQKLIERLNLATHAAQMGIWDWDIQKNELVWDDQMYRLYGLNPDNFGGAYEAWLNGLHPDDRKQSDEASQMAVRGEKEYDTEFRVLWPDGSIHWLKANGQVFRDEKGNPLRMVGVNYDITARRQAEESLKESEEYLRLGYEAGDLGIWKNDLQTGSVEFDERARIHYGFDTLHTTLLEVTNRIHPDDLARVGSEIEAATSPDGSGKFTTEYRVIHADGSVHWLAIGVQVRFEGEGAQRHSVIGYGTTQDITGRKRAEEELRESERQYKGLFETSPAAIYLAEVICDAEGQPNNLRFLYVNPAFERFVHSKASDLVGRTAFECFPQGNSATIERQGRVALTGIADSFEGFSVPLNAYFETTVYSPRHGQCVTFLTDVTERKRAEKQILQMKRLYATLSQVNQAIVRVKDHADLYQSICDVSTKFGEFTLAWIGILDTTTGDIKPVAASGLDLAQWPFPKVNIHEGDFKNGLTATAIRTSRVVTSDDIAVDERTRPSQTSFAKYDYHSTAVVPFQLRGNTIGILSLVSSEAELFKAQDEILLLREMGGDISFALDTMETEKEHRQAETKIQRQLGQLNGLHAIDQAISSNMEMESTLNIVLQQALSLLKADAASILLSNDAQQRLDYAGGIGFRSASASQAQIHLGIGLAGQVGLTRELLHIPDLVQIGDKFLRAEMLKDDQFVEYFGVPLIAKDSLKGVLEIFNRTPTNPDSEWLNFLEILGGQTAIAIENAQLFKELQQSNAELEQRVKQRTNDLLHVNAELEHANRTKDEFLANMSHELRTPLTGILGLSEALQLNTYGQITERQSKALKGVEVSGRHLLELINDILDLSKIEAGKFDIYPEMLNIEDTCKASLLFVKEQANKKSIQLDYQLPENVKSVFADPRRLKQMLVNLLSNAVKFTPEKGEVTLIVHADSEKGQIHFSITDTGVGIAREDLDRLFTPFTQVDSRLNRQYEGTGLGLVLVLRLAEMHGGSVQVESTVGMGSRFTVSLPWQQQVITPAETSEQISVQALEQSAPNINGVLLLAEDNPTNIEAIGAYLQFKGYTLVVASNGMEALIKAEECNPRLILMDIQMPVMDGLEATRRLRTDPRFASTPIIALTALAMIGDRERCLEAGANDYLSKPVSLKELAERVEKLLQP